MKKDCMFQFATKNEVLFDTDLITLREAVQLFNDNKDSFKDLLSANEDPEMVVWINCTSNTSYGKTLLHWQASEFKVINGDLYKLELAG